MSGPMYTTGFKMNALAAVLKAFGVLGGFPMSFYDVLGGSGGEPNSRRGKPRSKYSPHQGARECSRRMRQIAKTED